MFTFMQSTATKLAIKFARRDTATSQSIVTVVDLGNNNVEQAYTPKFHEGLTVRLHTVSAKGQVPTVLDDIKNVGLRVIGKAKKLWTKSTSSPATLMVSESESFGTPYEFAIEETEMPFNPIRRRPRVRTHRDLCINPVYSAYGPYHSTSEDEYGPGYEADQSASKLSEESAHLDTSGSYPHQDLSDILEESEYEWEPENQEHYEVPEVEGDAETSTPSDLETRLNDFGATPRLLAVTDPAASPVSAFFCPPTPASTLGPSTPPGSGSGPSTPILVYESISYEEELFAEFRTITHAAENDAEWDALQDAFASRHG
ncbi:hypothetical protein B0F90DRAFT_177963 [Multifurca ochricompacta]|uniref:Uncharacterized protein n=1 Tax=Multifurca ochricompacta TaxID=376703 RepID=A0AAD4M636_9AGAM|nr:hypothetical protein B0F90DRAFT_177963 [Multifurca ochricompacta]